MRQRVRWVAAVAVLLGTRTLGAQADSAGRLFPLLEFGVARSLPATLADRSVTARTNAGDTWDESVHLRLDGQWGLVAEGRVPVGRRKVWGIEAYAAAFRGGAHASAAMRLAGGQPVPVGPRDTIDFRLTRVTSWRGTLGVARAVPLPARWTGVLLLGGTYGRVTSPQRACAPSTFPGSVACPKLDLTTPGATVGADAITRPWHGVRLRFAAKGDVLRVDEAEVRRSLHWTPFGVAPAGEGSPRWHVLPTGTIGVEFRLPL
jgi:hypothetical protein